MYLILIAVLGNEGSTSLGLTVSQPQILPAAATEQHTLKVRITVSGCFQANPIAPKTERSGNDIHLHIALPDRDVCTAKAMKSISLEYPIGQLEPGSYTLFVHRMAAMNPVVIETLKPVKFSIDGQSSFTDAFAVSAIVGGLLVVLLLIWRLRVGFRSALGTVSEKT